MPARTADAEWKGALRDGSGSMRLGSGAFEGPYSFSSRFEDGSGTNPEELIGAAHAGCYSMALANILGKAGHVPDRVHTSAAVHLEQVEGGFAISRVDLTTEGSVPGMDEATFRTHAEDAKVNCPVSKALAGVEITLEATLT